MREFVDETEQQLLEPLQTAQIGQTNMWDTMRYGTQESPFARDPQTEAHRRMIARHKLWLESLQHEYPSPYATIRSVSIFDISIRRSTRTICFIIIVRKDRCS